MSPDSGSNIVFPTETTNRPLGEATNTPSCGSPEWPQAPWRSGVRPARSAPGSSLGGSVSLARSIDGLRRFGDWCGLQQIMSLFEVIKEQVFGRYTPQNLGKNKILGILLVESEPSTQREEASSLLTRVSGCGRVTN